jgi:hypothetical protein
MGLNRRAECYPVGSGHVVSEICDEKFSGDCMCGLVTTEMFVGTHDALQLSMRRIHEYRSCSTYTYFVHETS